MSFRTLADTIKSDGGFISNKARRVTAGTKAEAIVHDLCDEFDRLYCKYADLASIVANLKPSPTCPTCKGYMDDIAREEAAS